MKKNIISRCTVSILLCVSRMKERHGRLCKQMMLSEDAINSVPFYIQKHSGIIKKAHDTEPQRHTKYAFMQKIQKDDQLKYFSGRLFTIVCFHYSCPSFALHNSKGIFVLFRGPCYSSCQWVEIFLFTGNVGDLMWKNMFFFLYLLYAFYHSNHATSVSPESVRTCVIYSTAVERKKWVN